MIALLGYFEFEHGVRYSACGVLTMLLYAPSTRDLDPDRPEHSGSGFGGPYTLASVKSVNQCKSVILTRRTVFSKAHSTFYLLLSTSFHHPVHPKIL